MSFGNGRALSALRALVSALPECEKCCRPATRGAGLEGDDFGRDLCDEHGAAVEEMPWAAALREAVAVVRTADEAELWPLSQGGAEFERLRAAQEAAKGEVRAVLTVEQLEAMGHRMRAQCPASSPFRGGAGGYACCVLEDGHKGDHQSAEREVTWR